MRSFVSAAPRALRPLASRCARPAVRIPCFRSFSSTLPRRQEERQWSTPLAKQLYEAISLTGPVPLASYMRMCLTGDLGGYYTGAIGEGRDQFGTRGDFITSPEISQVFGELIGIWFTAEWIGQGQPTSGVQVIEVGPGRGTLMDDVLRTIQRFPVMARSIDSIYMVEASRELREAQQKLLCGPNATFTETELGLKGTSKYGGTPIIWSETIKPIPTKPNNMPFIVAHEFFDALPIHAFESVAVDPEKSPAPGGPSSPPYPIATKSSTEWREMMVSPTPPGVTHMDLKTPKSEHGEPVPEFQLILSSTTTRHSRYVPESSPRYRSLKSTPGSVIEVCPDASMYANDFATRIGGSDEKPKPRASGAALILDYGTSDTVPVNSLRGIRHHRRVNPFSAPGLIDLSADVDFTAIAEAAMDASPGVEVHGPVDQSYFLEAMGIRQRAEVLAKAPNLPKETVDNIHKSWRRLVDRGPDGMGKLYKVLAIVPENDGLRPPVGFGGDVQYQK
ncbi:NADH dehydrogenase [Geosmithia morbida]|uniref:Protein arginine methyltransferase NDUFAF7 n=1 Tax=Geosmithia morbida TaxID=1094350 RepID=A0A9P4YX40_9HYPO|nr:NADH dehydrogenase [Geosmithia morbida]KAF4123283.1 NADH dehydrogenase [Geosmithia morbida]